MKKALSLILALVLCLSMSACNRGNNDASKETAVQPSKEELIADAIETDVLTLEKAATNRAKAKQDYCNKPIIVSGRVSTVRDDHVLIRDQYGQVSVRAYLSIDELVKLEQGRDISVVGIISDIQDLETLGSSILYATYIMDLAYLIEQ